MLTAPFSNTRTLKFRSQLANAFFTTINQVFGGSFQLLTTAKHGGKQIVEHSSDKKVLGSSQKLGGAAEHLIDGSKKCVWSLLSFDFLSLHVIERRSNNTFPIYLYVAGYSVLGWNHPGFAGSSVS